MNENTEARRRSFTLALLTLFLLSAALNIFLWRRHNNIIEVTTAANDSLVTARVNIEEELLKTSSELQAYRGLSTHLDSMVTTAFTEIAAQNQKIRDLVYKRNIYSKENSELKTELGRLRALREKYIEKIDSLLSENKQLKAHNNQLVYTVTTLSAKETKNSEALATPVKPKLTFSNISSFKKRLLGGLTETSLAGNTIKLESCIKFRDQKSIQKSSTIYLRILNPEGFPLQNKNDTSTPVFTNKETREEMIYTLKKEVPPSEPEEPICISYNTEKGRLKPGTYLLEVYLDGYLQSSSLYILR